MKKFAYWLPRVLSVLIVAFFALFILEGFGPGFGWRDSLGHAVVALVVLGATIMAWKRPKIGGGFFIVFSLPFFSNAHRLNGAIIGGVLFIIGALFLIEGFRKNKTDK